MYNLDVEPQISEPYFICHNCYNHITHDFIKYNGSIYHADCFQKLQKRARREFSLFGFTISI